MKLIKKVLNTIRPIFKLGNSLNEIRLGFEPQVGNVANFAEGYLYKFRGNTYHVVGNRWVQL